MTDAEIVSTVKQIVDLRVQYRELIRQGHDSRSPDVLELTHRASELDKLLFQGPDMFAYGDHGPLEEPGDVVTRTKEEVYDNELFPIVKEVLRIAVQYRIACVLHFDIPTPKDKGLSVTSALIGAAYEPSQRSLAAAQLLNQGFAALIRR